MWIFGCSSGESLAGPSTLATRWTTQTASFLWGLTAESGVHRIYETPLFDRRWWSPERLTEAADWRVAIGVLVAAQSVDAGSA